MKKPDLKKIINGKEESSESLVALVYYFAKDWMRPQPDHPLALQILLFIVKLPVLVLFLVLSPFIMLVLLMTFLVGF